MANPNEQTAGIDFTATKDVPEFPLGRLEKDKNGTLYRYIGSPTALTQYKGVVINPATYLTGYGTAGVTPMVVSNIGASIIGVPQHANFTAPSTGYSYRYGWVASGGEQIVISCLDNVTAPTWPGTTVQKVYPTAANAGCVSINAAVTSLLAGLQIASTTAGGGNATFRVIGGGEICQQMGNTTF